jgi:hypothetical protein
LIAKLLHLLSRLDAGNLRDIVIVQSFRVALQQVKDLFLVGHVVILPNKNFFHHFFSQKFLLDVNKTALVIKKCF